MGLARRAGAFDVEPIVRIDEILGPFRGLIGSDFEGYRNHVQRMTHACFALADAGALGARHRSEGGARPGREEDAARSAAPLLSDAEREKIVIAACFHDIGLWTAGTFDYIEPSIAAAREHLTLVGRAAWIPEVETMIAEHHKLRAYRGGGLIELFRRGDLLDFSLGVFRSGLSRRLVRAVKMRYPNAGFHRGLVRRALRWGVRHPLNPAPMAKW
jgi:hypothetical protein